MKPEKENRHKIESNHNNPKNPSWSIDLGDSKLLVGAPSHRLLICKNSDLSPSSTTRVSPAYLILNCLIFVQVACFVLSSRVSVCLLKTRFFFSNVSLTPQTRLSRFTPFSLLATHWSLRFVYNTLTACARSKHVELGIQLFSSICSVELGIQLFSSICSEYKIIPTSKHYGCITDLIGRAGLLVDASVLGALLGACKIHVDAELGNNVGKWLIRLQPQHCGQYVALSTLNALESNWKEAEQMRKVMIQARIRKIPAYYSVLC